MHSECNDRGFFRWFPDHGIATDQRQRGIPCPHRNREIERGNDTANTQRVPGFHHAMTWALGRDGQAVQLARQADSEIADVDHFLHFTYTFGQNLAGFQRHQFAQRLAMFAQHVAQDTHQLAAYRRRHYTPFFVGLVGVLDGAFSFLRRVGAQRSNRGAVAWGA